VFDTNVVISALAYPGSNPRQALDLAFSEAVILTSTVTLAELAGVLGRKKFRRYLSADEAAAFLTLFSQRSVPVLITTEASVARDPDDNAFVSLAIDGRANFLVTGDRNLLVLGAVGATEIVTPAAFLDTVRADLNRISPKT
jgi:uncharacterized protein